MFKNLFCFYTTARDTTPHIQLIYLDLKKTEEKVLPVIGKWTHSAGCSVVLLLNPVTPGVTYFLRCLHRQCDLIWFFPPWKTWCMQSDTRNATVSNKLHKHFNSNSAGLTSCNVCRYERQKRTTWFKLCRLHFLNANKLGNTHNTPSLWFSLFFSPPELEYELHGCFLGNFRSTFIFCGHVMCFMLMLLSQLHLGYLDMP